MAYRPLTDTMLLCRPKVPYYGAYPSGFLERARYLLGVTINSPVLHICGGRVKDYQSGPMRGKGLGPHDRTVDLDPSVEPDYLLDVRRIGVNPGDVTPCLQLNRDSYEWEPATFENTEDDEGVWRTDHDRVHRVRHPYHACLIDRPYTEEDADKYGETDRTHLPALNDLLRRALSITREGGRVGVLDYYFPRPPRDGVKLIFVGGVLCGWGNRIRCFSVYERTAHNPLEYNVTGEKTEDEEVAATLPEPDVVNAATGQLVLFGEEGTTVTLMPIDDVPKKPVKRRRPKKLAKKRRRVPTDGFQQETR